MEDDMLDKVEFGDSISDIIGKINPVSVMEEGGFKFSPDGKCLVKGSDGEWGDLVGTAFPLKAGIDNAIIAADHTSFSTIGQMRINVSDEMVESIEEKLLEDVEFVSKIQNPKYEGLAMTKMGKDMEERLGEFSSRISRMEETVNRAIEKIDLFLQGFQLPD
jgi:hypothetical protein